MSEVQSSPHLRPSDSSLVMQRPSDTQPIPMRVSDTQPPSTKAWPGLYNFDVIQIGRENRGERTSCFFFSETLGKLFVEMNKACPFEVTMNPFPKGKEVVVRALPVYSVAGSLHDVVKRCANHSMASDPSNFGFEQTDHLLRSDKLDAIYEKDHKDGRLSVVVPMNKPYPGTNTVPLILRFMCLHSCNGGINRRPLSIVFTLEVDGEVVGRKSIEVRICACPNRDRRLQEQKALRCISPLTPEMYYDKKKKLDDGGGRSKSSVYFIVVQSKKVYDVLMTLKENLELAEKYRQATPSGVHAYREKDALLQQSFNRMSQRHSDDPAFEYFDVSPPSLSRAESESDMMPEESSDNPFIVTQSQPPSPTSTSQVTIKSEDDNMFSLPQSSQPGNSHVLQQNQPTFTTVSSIVNSKPCSIVVLQPNHGDRTGKQVQLRNLHSKIVSVKPVHLQKTLSFEDLNLPRREVDAEKAATLRKTYSAKDTYLNSAMMDTQPAPSPPPPQQQQQQQHHEVREIVMRHENSLLADDKRLEGSEDESQLREEERNLLRRAEYLKAHKSPNKRKNSEPSHMTMKRSTFCLTSENADPNMSKLLTLSEVAASLHSERSSKMAFKKKFLSSDVMGASGD